ncbi:MAG: PQQ-binding-like beta-propeller repeat protein [Ignavibacteriales bacterium]|nr:PQQ-binding-like beta-propeller repeat protein [Ignavibacteriales bacterium]
MKTRLLWLLLCGLVPSFFVPAQVPKWKLDFGEQIKDYSFLQDGKFLFLSNYEYSWLYDAATGAKVYELQVKKWEKKGVHQLIGEKFLIGTSKGLQCYDALTAKLLWEQEYPKVDQDEFSDLDWLGNVLVVRYDKIHIGIDLTTGKELWRSKIAYNGDVSKKGGWNYKKLEKQNLLLVFMDDDKLGLFQFADGKQVFDAEKYEINGKLIEKSRKYFYTSPDERYLVFLLDDQIAVVDAVDRKELKRVPMKYDTDFGTIIETPHGCIVLGKEKIVFVNDKTGDLTEVKADVGDFRTYDIRTIGTKDIFFAGLSDAMFAIDLIDGKVLWQTAEKDKNFEGYAHRYLKLDGDNLILAYTRGSGYSDDGTNVHVMSVNALTGKVNYRTPAIFNSKLYTPNWQRSAAKFMKKTVETLFTNAQTGPLDMFGYENIGYDYTTDEFEGNLVFGLVSTYLLRNPDTKDEPGDGVVIVDPKTGQILFKDYVRVSDYTSSPSQAPAMKPMIVENKMFLVGDESIAAYDLTSKKRMWFSEKLLKGIPREAMLIDQTLFIKFGERKFNVGLEPPKGLFGGQASMKIDSRYDIDPYGFAAYDLASGKQLWRVETKVDPSFLTPNFSLKNNYDEATKRLYFADEENIYALQCRPDGGKYDYTLKLGKIGVGEMPFKKIYAIQEWPIGKKTTTSSSYSIGSTTYTTTTKRTEIGGADYNKFISEKEEADASCHYPSWGGGIIWGATAKKTLRVVFAGTHLFAIGEESIALLDASDGKVVWKLPWDYDPSNLQFVPKILGNKLVYCLDRQLTCVDISNGETLWQQKEAKRPLFFSAPSEKYLYTIDEEVIKGYELEKQK